MIGPLLAYGMVGFLVATMTTEDYCASIKPTAWQVLGFVLLCILTWPWVLWQIFRVPRRG